MYLFGEVVEGGLHAGAVLALDDGHDVVVVAKLVEVVLPALLVILFGADEVVARRVVFEARRGGDGGDGAQDQRDAEDDARVAADQGDERDEETTHQVRLLGGELFRLHGNPFASGSVPAPPSVRGESGGRIVGQR